MFRAPFCVFAVRLVDTFCRLPHGGNLSFYLSEELGNRRLVGICWSDMLRVERHRWLVMPH